MIQPSLPIGIILGWLVMANLAYALGLGEIIVQSKLNQALEARIPLLEMGDLTSADIVVGLGSAQAFESTGIERVYFLTELDFSVITEGRQAFVKVSSKETVQEPFLDFLLQVTWPQGQLLKEYVVFLDPPVLGPPPTTYLPATTAATQPRPFNSSATETVANNAVTAPTQMQAMQNYNSYHVAPSDTLWSIAAKAKSTANTSVQAIMLTIHQLNPHAFINNDINLLKKGETLRIPADIQPAIEAPAKPAEKSIATSAAEATAKPDQLKILTPEEEVLETQVDIETVVDEPVATSVTDNKVVALENELAIAQENVEKSRWEQEKLQAKQQELEKQLAKLNQLLELKNTEITNLQKKLGGAPANTNSTINTWQWLGIITLLLAVAASVWILFKRRYLFTTTANNNEEVLVEEEPQTSDEILFGPAAEEEHLAKKKIKQEATVNPVAPKAVQATKTEVDEAEPQTSDPISEADIYIAYGRFPQAIALLRNVLGKEPNRIDVHLKLMEVLSETKDQQGFIQEKQTLLQLMEIEGLHDTAILDKITQLQTRIGAEAETAAVKPMPPAAISAIVGSTPAAPETEIAATPARELEFDISDIDFSRTDADKKITDTEIDSHHSVDFSAASTSSSQTGVAEDTASAETVNASLENDIASQLDLARAYIDMQDFEEARSLLENILAKGNESQQQEAKQLMQRLS